MGTQGAMLRTAVRVCGGGGGTFQMFGILVSFTWWSVSSVWLASACQRDNVFIEFLSSCLSCIGRLKHSQGLARHSQIRVTRPFLVHGTTWVCCYTSSSWGVFLWFVQDFSSFQPSHGLGDEWLPCGVFCVWSGAGQAPSVVFGALS